jgi:hypothetical protein
MKISNYTTEDIYLTAYLLSANICSLVRIDDLHGQRKSFILHPSPSQDEITNFYTGSGKVSALELCSRLRSLKAAVRVRGV